MWRDFSNALREAWQVSSAGSESYRADLHYMRGPGPKWHAKHACLLAAAPASALHATTAVSATRRGV